MRKILGSKFFARETLIVAENLLGKFIVRRQGQTEIAYQITEAEAYDGPQDKASHANRGKTSRNQIMFGPPGCFYIYLVYGFHQMLNIVTGMKSYPAAILIRGVTGVNGPGRVPKVLGIDKSFYAKIATQKTGLWFEDWGAKISAKQIKRLPRIGVAYAGPLWSAKKYRFKLMQEN